MIKFCTSYAKVAQICEPMFGTLGESWQMVANQLVEAAAVRRGGRTKLFCLGPFSRRVNFSAQQNRALNLVWALHEEKEFASGDRIAVIGAGVAGLTAAAAFIGHGCKVDVYETGATPLARQRATEHRLVHPTISQWPYEPLSITTQLPFLEWYAGKCSDITDNLLGQFNIIKGSSSLLPGKEVIDILQIATDLLQIVVKSLEPRPTYKLVLIAIGFGQEVTSSEFDPYDYWTPDNLEVLRYTDPSISFIVSGCGDGGLIDALRLALKDFRRGRIVFETAAALSNSELAKAVQKAEDECRAGGSLDDLGKAYAAAAQQLDEDRQYRAAVEKLQYWGGAPVELLDNALSAPASRHSAPIHKLLIAHAVWKGSIRFTRGEVKLDGDTVRAGGRSFPRPPKSRVIVRHGAKQEFGRLLKDEEVIELKLKQEKTFDYYADKKWPSTFPTPPQLPAYNPTSPDISQ
jgi:hypothetical protein